MPNTYIKVLYKLKVYGPFTDCMTLQSLCTKLDISESSSPILLRIGEPGSIECRMDTIGTGFWEMIADPSFVKYSERKDIDHSHVHTRNHKVAAHYSDMHEVNEFQFPLSERQLSSCLNSMVYLIASIPPRYIKYNKLLSAQVDVALSQIEQWLVKYDQMCCKANSNKFKVTENSMDDPKLFLTFIQYRVLNMLYDIWTRVWTRFSPLMRINKSINTQNLESIVKIEDILSRFSVWRRMLQRNQWQKIKIEFTGQQWKCIAKDVKLDILMPPRILSDEHANTQIALFNFGTLRGIN